MKPAPGWFRDPEERFRPAAFWFWHRIPTEPEIVAQVADMLAKGIGRAMIQARPALPLDAYLSPAYLDAYRLAAREALRRGLKLTIYDEYGWMSGHGGGRTVEGAGSLRERHLFWAAGLAEKGRVELRISDIRSPFLDFLGDAGRQWLYDGGAPVWGDWEPVLAVAHAEDAEAGATRALPAAALRVESDGATSCRVAVDFEGRLGPETAVTVFVAARCTTSRLVNYLLPEAAERFAATVYAPLLEAAGEAADGFFFDHPHAGFYVWDEQRSGLGNSILWDGHPLAPGEAAQLLALTRDGGPETGRLRAGFLEDYARRMHEAFFGTLSRWARARGMGFTGHELLTHVGAWGLQAGLTGFDPRCMPGLDYFGVDRFRSQTAVDAADYAPQLSARFGDSVARANGRSRCMVEQYSTGRETGMPALAGQWGLTAERFRGQAIRHLLAGARQIVLHAVNVSDGVPGDGLLSPRFDFPPAFNFEPWWEDFPAIAAELARLSAFLEEGESVRPVALLYPLETIRAGGASPDCCEHFGWWAEALARNGIGYDILDERQLETALAPGTRYKTLVLPSAAVLARRASADAIAGFCRRGGWLEVSGAAPLGCREAPSPALAALLREPAEGIRLMPDAREDDVSRAVASLPRAAPDVRIEGGPCWTAVAECDGGWRVAAFNDGEEVRLLEVRRAPPSAAVEVWNAADGTFRQMEPERRAGGRVFPLRAQELICFCLREGAHAGEPLRPAVAAVAEALPPITLSGGWRLSVEGSDPVPVSFEEGWEKQGFPSFAGTGVYTRGVELPALPPGLEWRLLLPGFRGTAECRVDGVPVGRHVAGSAAFAMPGAGACVTLELRVRNTAANRYYPGTPFGRGDLEPSGLLMPPRLVAVEARAGGHVRAMPA